MVASIDLGGLLNVGFDGWAPALVGSLEWAEPAVIDPAFIIQDTAVDRVLILVGLNTVQAETFEWASPQAIATGDTVIICMLISTS